MVRTTLQRISVPASATAALVLAIVTGTCSATAQPFDPYAIQPAAPACSLLNPCGSSGCSLCAPRGGGWVPCCPLPKIDQTGEHIFAPHPPHYHKVPHPWGEHHRPSGVVVWPRRAIAPVGSEVVLLAGICNKDSHLRADENVEWILSSGGVGHLVAVGRRNSLHCLNLLTAAPKKVDNTYAIGTTSSHYLLLTRGTPTPDDDIAVQKGQAWATVSSPVEGTSYVTVYGPDVYGWDRHQQTAEIYWVDAQWQFPPAAVNPVGTRHTFTTVVTKFSNRAPVIGWRVRYEITGGPEAGFAPDGAKVAEVPTNELGQASVEIFQPAPAAGTNQISIQVIRPDDSATGNQRMVLGTGTTTKTWSSPDIALRKTGPAQASVGALATYRIEVSNPGDALVRDVVVTDQLPSGMSHDSSNPPATVQGNQLEWRLGDIAGHQSRAIELHLRVEQAGTYTNCASLTTAEGLTAQNCVTTTVGASTLDVRMTAPETAVVGQDVTFQVSVTNRGGVPATGLKVVDRFDAGFQHPSGASPLEHALGDIPPGGTANQAITLRIVQPGQWCNEVDVVGPSGTLGGARSCVNATQGAPGQPPPPAAATPTGQATIAVEKTGPTAPLNVGDEANFDIVITNTGAATVNDLKIADHYDVALDPVRATDGYTFVGDDLVWQIDTLPPGRKVRLQIHCRCQQSIDRACNRVTVTTREGARGDGEACVQIRQGGGPPAAAPPTAPSQPTAPAQPAAPSQPTAGNLGVTISDRTDPAQAGREVDYEIRVTNPTNAPAQQVSVGIAASPELTPIAIGTSGPTGYNITGQQVQFRPVAELPAGETRTYVVRMRAARTGAGRVSVQVSSQGMQSPATAEETTTVLTGP